MAKSPLARLVLQASRTVRGAQRAGLDVVEYAQLRRDGIDRRRLLQSTGVLAAMAALGSSCASKRPSGSSSKARVLVVGGGVAGLHCAYRLQLAGIAAEVFEASTRVGGRIHTDRATFAPQSCELGGELIDTGHETMLGLIDELELGSGGSGTLDFSTDDPALEATIAFLDGRRYTVKELLVDYAPIAEAVDQALASLTDPEEGVGYGAPNGGEALDAMSIRSWFDSIGASGRIRKFLEIAYLTEYGIETDRSNALNMLFMVSTDLVDFELFGESDERYRVAKGNDAVTDGLASRLSPGSLHRGSRLIGLRAKPDGRMVATFQRDGATHEQIADHVVSAIPFSMLREVEVDVEMSEVKRRAIRELELGMSSKLMVGFRSRPWRRHGSNGEVFTDLPFQCTWETSRLQKGDAGILTNFSGGNHAVRVGEGTAASQADALIADVEKVFPGARQAYDGRCVRMHWPTHPLTRGAYAGYTVGQYTAFSGVEIERAGNLHFCGEHTSIDAQGFMEGGALTGAMAAVEVAGDLGVDLELAAASAPARRIVARAARARRLSNRVADRVDRRRLLVARA